MPGINADDALAEASAQTGLDDYGPSEFRDGLRTLCAAVTDEAELSELGAVAVHSTVVNSLTNRLHVVEWIKAHGRVADEEIRAPLVVIGMFRAGTTFLSELLDQDPRNRALLRWEAGDSVPPPSSDLFRSGPRVDAARASAEMLPPSASRS